VPDVRPYDPSQADAWDDAVARSVNGTFLHTRRYLGYHGDRFRDLSVTVDGAVLAAAADPGDATRVVSHPGLTYGGLVHDGSLRGEALLDALRAVAAHYRELGYATLRYKAVPSIYHREPAQDDLYALFRLGARLYRRDLSATVELAAGTAPRGDRRRNPRVAERRGATLVDGPEHLDAFWRVLTDSLARRHGATPVHTAAELRELIARFPDRITVETVHVAGEVVAGTVHYVTDRVLHCQYSAASPEGAKAYALDLAFATAIDRCRAAGLPFYDFGVSTESDGTVLNASLYDFKTSFGARGTVCDFYELDL
jgi:hypothetical protein